MKWRRSENINQRTAAKLPSKNSLRIHEVGDDFFKPVRAEFHSSTAGNQVMTINFNVRGYWGHLDTRNCEFHLPNISDLPYVYFSYFNAIQCTRYIISSYIAILFTFLKWLQILEFSKKKPSHYGYCIDLYNSLVHYLDTSLNLSVNMFISSLF